MDVLLTHVAGMDVHQKEIVVCVLTGSEDGSLYKEINTFSTLIKSLYELLNGWKKGK